MIIVPSVAVLSLLVILSVLGASILRKPWQRWCALGCAIVEMAVIIFLVILVSMPAYAQSVQQSGNVTPGHVGTWITNGVLGDGGAAPGGPIFTGSTTLNDFACVGASGTIIDCGVGATVTSAWSGLQNFNGGATAPTRAPGDNTTNVATTAFVNVAIGNGALNVGTSPVSNGTSTGLFYDNAGVLGNFTTITGVNGGALSIAPTPATINQGLLVTQTSPGGTVAGPVNLNTFDTTFSTPTITGAGRDAFGSLNSNAYGLRVNTTLSGTFGGASAYSGFISAMRITGAGGTSADKLAMVGTVYVNVPVTSGGGVAGNSNWSYIDSAGSLTTFLEGYETDSGIATGGSVPTRVGIGIWNVGAVRGSTLDAAIAVTNITSGGEFQKLISLSGYANGSTLPSLSSTADLFSADQAITIANVFNASNFTVTGNILNFPGVVLAGSGNYTVTNNANSANPVIQINNNNAGAAALSEFVANNGTNTASFGMGGAGLALPYTGRGFVTANGTASLVVGTSGNAPVLFVMNNVEVGRWGTTAGNFLAGVIGTTVGNYCTANATSGTICLAPPTGALGSAVLTLPAVTATVLTTGNAGGVISTANNSLSGDVLLNNTANYFDGPSAAQGTAGKWLATGTVTLAETSTGSGNFFCKLWDGTTVIASDATTNFAGAANYTMSLSGLLTSPVGNIRISCRDTGTTTGKILFNASGNSADSSVTVIRIN